MDDHPEQQGHKSARSNAAALQYGEVPADDGHGPFVEIVEGALRSFALEQVEYHLPRVASLLGGNLGYARQRTSSLAKRGDVAHGEHAAHARHSQVRIDGNSPGSVGRTAQRLYDRGSRDPRSPQDRGTGDGHASGDDAFLVNALNSPSRENLYPEFVEPLGSFG